MARASGVCLVVALLALVATPSAAQDRLALACDDSSLAEALHVALAPWSVEVVRVPGASPGASMPGSAERGRALAQTHRARAVAWISESDAGWALWTYDAAADRVLARRLASGPPFDEATAAAVALSIKTLLRHGSLAPPEERLEPPRGPREVAISVGLGARGLATEPGDAEARASLLALAFPAAWGGVEAGPLGLGAALRAGAGVDASTPSLAARWNEARLSFAMALRAHAGEGIDLGGTLELGAALSWLEGVALPSLSEARDVRVDLAFAGSIELGWAPLGWLRLALRGGLEGAARDRVYLVRGQPALSLPIAAPTGELVVELRP